MNCERKFSLKNGKWRRFESARRFLVHRGWFITVWIPLTAVREAGPCRSEGFSTSHLRQRQMEAFCRWSWIAVIKKTQTAPRSQPNTRAGQCPDRRAESEGVSDQKLDAFYHLFFSVSFLSHSFCFWGQTGASFAEGIWSPFSPLTVKIWQLLIRFPPRGIGRAHLKPWRPF